VRAGVSLEGSPEPVPPSPMQSMITGTYYISPEASLDAPNDAEIR